MCLHIDCQHEESNLMNDQYFYLNGFMVPASSVMNNLSSNFYSLKWCWKVNRELSGGWAEDKNGLSQSSDVTASLNHCRMFYVNTVINPPFFLTAHSLTQLLTFFNRETVKQESPKRKPFVGKHNMQVSSVTESFTTSFSSVFCPACRADVGLTP